MENLIKELKKIFLFKADTQQGDIVLIVAEKPQTMIYALITDIVRDETRRDEWWHVTLNLLTLPPQKIIWTMREPQFTGKEVFTMGGEKRFIQALEFYRTDGPKSGRKSIDTIHKRSTLRVIK
ncbi:MAG: hypothetical protein A2511_14515 [Deltaproteobacteria bacterium RIFOXYD12_FULL_50_9]|nr:MAG: hypothetical protein A2511_14515 [Deltaproteobacteria bacterium RIFOXYD12_FULL_50_9]